MVFCSHKSATACRWKRRKEARPEEILDAALALFTEKGFSATRMVDVAKKAGISKGTLYLYFDNKEAIFRSVIQEKITPQLSRVEDLIEHFEGSSAELLQQIIQHWWNSIGQTELSAIPKLVVSEAGNFPEFAEFFVNNVVKRARKLMASAISRGMASGEFNVYEPETVARLVISPLVQMVIWMHSLQPYDDAMNVDDVVNLHVEFIINGLVKKQ
ncbi:MAG: TetR/AcrR family transcriptional regulator [Gammaproteobacteria bacterium]|nr:TetR/AcrR family transcriptional regulator [Gammaproteobacteria bacterium]